ncbi:MAG: acetate kinase [Desulfomonile tiedjei]|nr:acetate kinase [Desulfomonile tiedjei]
MKTLVINSGSSSLKYTLFDMAHETVLFAGGIERIGLPGGVHVSRFGSDEETRKAVNVGDHGQALDDMLATLIAGPLESLDQLAAVAHRVGHGGKYWDAVRIDDEVLAEIRRMTPMIPLHHPAMIEEIEECRVRMPHAVHVAVFDTWFHKSIPVEAAIYGLPYRYFAERGYRRTGFHGNSHAYVSLTAAQFLRRNLDELKVISCHLGNGASICAIARGKSIDTTLGMTAVEGLIMGTRSGDVDPGLIPIIMEEDSLSPGDLIDLLYKESGLKGISGVSSDMREVEAAAEQGNERAVLALNAFCYKVKRSIGAMLMVLGGCDVLIFTGGIGCNRPTVRSKALAGTERLGFVIDEALNSRACVESPVTDISPPSLPTRILVIRTFEELMMARQCVQAIGWAPGSE